MNYTNEEIARAAGWTNLKKAGWFDALFGYPPDWEEHHRICVPCFATSPGAVATWLLPVLEKRWPEYVTTRSFTPADPLKEMPFGVTEFPYAIWQSEFHIGDDSNGVTAPTWHTAIIEAIMATAEGGK